LAGWSISCLIIIFPLFLFGVLKLTLIVNSSFVSRCFSPRNIFCGQFLINEIFKQLFAWYPTTSPVKKLSIFKKKEEKED